MTANPTLTRREIRTVFKRHRGASFQLAAALGLSRTSISLWLRGKLVSQRIADAANERAQQLMATEPQKEEVA